MRAFTLPLSLSLSLALSPFSFSPAPAGVRADRVGAARGTLDSRGQLYAIAINDTTADAYPGKDLAAAAPRLARSLNAPNGI